MAEAFLGEVRPYAFPFAPRGWALANGQSLAINQNQALFSLLGTTFGGNGTTTFFLPNLQGRVAIGVGQGAGLSNYSDGQSGGSESVTLLLAQIPAHNHSYPAHNGAGTTDSPAGTFPANSGQSSYGSPVSGAMAPDAIAPVGGSQSHNNMAPYTSITYAICLQGIFPSRN